jgi:cobalt/nickel transport system permease protein
MSAQAMHIANGIVDGQVSAVFAVVSLAALTLCVLRGRADLDDRLAPMAGLVAAFIFAVQMLNFPVASGTSGHLLGGALAAVLVGPWTGILCMSTVFLVQCLLFADGGITALGTNITLMGLTTVAVGWLVFRLLQAVLPKRLSLVPLQAGVAAFVSVPVAAALFVALYAIGGTADIPLGNLATAMVGVHVLIGIGEGVITFLAVGAILAVRPDLVYGARPILKRRELVIKPAVAA